jgi:recombination protein RecT
VSNLRDRAASVKTGTDVATPSTDLRAQIRRMEAEFQVAMPRGMEAKQLIRDAMTVISQNPGLMRCDPRSVLGALMTCSQLGLRPGVLGQAWVIPFKGKGQLIVGYQGLISLAQRSGDIASITARMVHENDMLDLEYGLDERLSHKPLMRGAHGPVIGYYSVVKSTKGGTYWEFMTHEDAEIHRDKFAMARKDGRIVGPWLDHFDAMALKTVIIRALKLAPRNTELVQGMAVDESIRVDVSPDMAPEDVSVTVTSSMVDGEVVPDGARDDVQVEDPPADGEVDPTLNPTWGKGDAR